MNLPAATPADQTIELTPTVRIRITRTPDAVVVRAERRSPASLDDDDWSPDLRAIAVPLNDVTLITSAMVAAARSA